MIFLPKKEYKCVYVLAGYINQYFTMQKLTEIFTKGVVVVNSKKASRREASWGAVWRNRFELWHELVGVLRWRRRGESQPPRVKRRWRRSRPSRLAVSASVDMTTTPYLYCFLWIRRTVWLRRAGLLKSQVLELYRGLWSFDFVLGLGRV